MNVYGKTREVKIELMKVLAEKIKASDIQFNLRFVEINDENLRALENTPHQIIVMFSNGRMQMLPKNITTRNQLRIYLGIRMSRVTHFSVLPIPGTGSHPRELKVFNKNLITLDVFNYA